MVELPPAKSRPLATGRAWALCLVALGVIAAGTVGLRVWDDASWEQYTQLRAEYEAARDSAVDSARGLTGDISDAVESLIIADTVSESAAGFVDDDAISGLVDQRATFGSALDEATPDSAWVSPQIAALDETALLWDVLGASTELSEASVTLADDRARLDATATRVRTGTNALNDDTIAVINAAGEIGQSELSKYGSATNDSYRALKAAAEGAVALSQINYGAADVVADVVSARDAMAASHQAKEAAKAGPLNAVRNEVEAFGRSIAGGVRLDFTWRDVVIGYGQGRSAAGTATWDTADDGYSSITLTNSIARYWSSWAGYRSLVAHEVGHAITSKCHDLFNTDLFKGDNERWATAWAIGMGYTVSAANGSDLYGVPSAAQIEAAKKCR